MADKAIKTLEELRSTQGDMLVVYDNPKDYPGKVIGRIWENGKPTNNILKSQQIGMIRIMVKAAGFEVRLKRCEADDPVIVETWIRMKD